LASSESLKNTARATKRCPVNEESTVNIESERSNHPGTAACRRARDLQDSKEEYEEEERKGCSEYYR
jgi:hypothetical protein